MAIVVRREQGEQRGKREKEEMELKCLKLEFHMDFKSTLTLQAHRTQVF